MSSQTTDILKKFGTFIIELRGEVEMKVNFVYAFVVVTSKSDGMCEAEHSNKKCLHCLDFEINHVASVSSVQNIFKLTAVLEYRSRPAANFRSSKLVGPGTW